MILVMLGTQDKPFNRLIEMVETLKEEKVITTSITMQVGYTTYDGKIKHYDFIDEKALDKQVKKADIIITHAGVGSIMKALLMKKKVIVVPRLKKYHEHMNDHQLQISKVFKDKGFIKVANNALELKKAILDIDNFTPKEIELNTSDLVKKVERIIEEES